MSKKSIIVGIISAALMAGLVKASGFYPELADILSASAALVAAISAYVGGMKEA